MSRRALKAPSEAAALMVKSFWRQLATHLATGEPALVGLVADHTRHSPGTRGARMFVRPNGSQVGTIGGGAMESAFASHVADPARYEIETLYHRADAAGKRSGLICAGRQTMVYVHARPDDAAVYARFADAVEADESVALRIENGEPEVVSRQVGVRPPIELVDGVYIEHAVNHRRIAILGGGHCGSALSRAMARLGYHVELFEERPDVYTFVEEQHADVKRVVSDFAEAGPLVSFPALTHFVVMTANVDADVRALLGGIELAFPYKGVMGSNAKIARILGLLRSAGLSEDRIGELHAPIGLDLASDTPEEIAISIAAQILRLRESLFPFARPSPS